MSKKIEDKDVEDLPEGYLEGLGRAMFYSKARQIMLRDEFAIRIMAGMCAGDWKLDLSDGKTWDKAASKRAYEIADAMLEESVISNV